MALYEMEKKTAEEVFERFRASQPQLALIDVIDIFEDYIHSAKFEGNPFQPIWAEVAGEKRQAEKDRLDALFNSL